MTIVHRACVVLLVAAVSFFLALPSAVACSCIEQSPKDSVDGADQVFLARARTDVATKGGFSQDFDVLHVLKGAPGKTFTWHRTEKNPLLDRSTRAGK